ncbi:MAG: ribosome-associated translation inhibitor RaiA [Candidatus Hydrogenedens sp.]|jgi:putative sigma-54 modulation protein|nr:ribosome-associated translation inhibitor RaiA [Candidatus Hydrogenedens sp.]
MNVTITGRRMDVTDALRSYVENGIKKLKIHFDKVVDINVVLDVEKHRHIADVRLLANGVRIHGRESTADMYASVDAVLAKLDRQISKYKGRINRHKQRSSPANLSYGHAILALQEEAAAAGVEQEEEQQHQIVNREKRPLQPMSIEEAIMQLDLLEDSFFVFLNADTSHVNVVYACEDNTYGLIEPEI